MDWRIRLPGALVRRATAKAGSDADLAALVRCWLETYVDGTSPQALGGRATAARRTPEERSASARAAVLARWERQREAKAEPR